MTLLGVRSRSAEALNEAWRDCAPSICRSLLQPEHRMLHQLQRDFCSAMAPVNRRHWVQFGVLPKLCDTQIEKQVRRSVKNISFVRLGDDHHETMLRGLLQEMISTATGLHLDYKVMWNPVPALSYVLYKLEVEPGSRLPQ